jgi:signal transduction histidine kinase
MRLTADQMAATAEKAKLIQELRRSNAALSDTNAELERQYSQVLEARRVKDEFLANVSHELRTPLTSVLGHIALMQEELTGPLTDAQRRDLAAVRRAAEQLLSLIETLLELTSLKGGTAEVFAEEFDPQQAIETAVRMTEGRRPEVELRVEPPPPFAPRIRTDLHKTTRILVSLLHNAYKFTTRGEVTVGFVVGNDRIVYRVQDTGIGLPDEARDAAFEEFRQLDGSTTRAFAGSGLGLALARRLARLLGGDVSFVSSPGDGSTFMLELPLDYDPAPTGSHVP